MRQCQTYGKKFKVKHESRQEAEKHLGWAQPTQLHKMSVYRCEKCMYWHVGRIPRTRIAKINLLRKQSSEEYLVGRLIAALIAVLRRENSVR